MYTGCRIGLYEWMRENVLGRNSDGTYTFWYRTSTTPHFMLPFLLPIFSVPSISSSLSFILYFLSVITYIYHIDRLHHYCNSLLCFKYIMFNVIIIVVCQPSGYTVLAFYWQSVCRHFNCYPFIVLSLKKLGLLLRLVRPVDNNGNYM